MVPEQTVRVCPVSTRRAPLSATVPSAGPRGRGRGAMVERLGDEFKFVPCRTEMGITPLVVEFFSSWPVRRRGDNNR